MNPIEEQVNVSNLNQPTVASNAVLIFLLDSRICLTKLVSGSQTLRLTAEGRSEIYGGFNWSRTAQSPSD